MKKTVCLVLVALTLFCSLPSSYAFDFSSFFRFSPQKSYGYDFESTWGELWEKCGPVYDTLTPYQQSLVNYPKLIPSKVYYVKNGKSFHAVDWCYTLSRSKDIRSITMVQAEIRLLEPCSKCVDPEQMK